MKLHMRDGYALVRPEEEDKVTAGGIHLTTVEKKQTTRGTVVAVGAGKVIGIKPGSGEPAHAPCDLREGNMVYYNSWSGDEIDFDGVPHMIILHDEIKAIQCE
jgi:co-chaperonin GroES (HSP10)